MGHDFVDIEQLRIWNLSYSTMSSDQKHIHSAQTKYHQCKVARVSLINFSCHLTHYYMCYYYYNNHLLTFAFITTLQPLSNGCSYSWFSVQTSVFHSFFHPLTFFLDGLLHWYDVYAGSPEGRMLTLFYIWN